MLRLETKTPQIHAARNIFPSIFCDYRCLRHPPVLSLSCRQQRRFLSEEVTPVQQVSPVRSGTGSAAVGVSEGMNGSNMNSTASADRLIWVDLEVKNTIRNFDVIHNLLLLCEFVADASIDYIILWYCITGIEDDR
ncbi:MAG: hypothetical protein MJE68_25585 [Proteobacteria bacterium]|nr:hypothetical protein [Pseudomonadota bacterium]